MPGEEMDTPANVGRTIAKYRQHSGKNFIPTLRKRMLIAAATLKQSPAKGNKQKGNRKDMSAYRKDLIWGSSVNRD
jgi:hypothetical protein